MATGTFRLNRPALTQLLRGMSGPVGKDLALTAQYVSNSAKRRCPVDTGRLRSSIRWAVFTDAQGLFAQVGTDVEYALFVERGTRYMEARPFLQPALDAVGLRGIF